MAIVRLCLYLLYLSTSARWQLISAQEAPDPGGETTARPFDDSITTPRPPNIAPSLRPSQRRTVKPSPQPTELSTAFFSVFEYIPTFSVSESETEVPEDMEEPTDEPTPATTQSPTIKISPLPTGEPSERPTLFPTKSVAPSYLPSHAPSVSEQPSNVPSFLPTASSAPTKNPSESPTESMSPSLLPTVSFMPTISMEPSSEPSRRPSESPSRSSAPSWAPSESARPTNSFAPSNVPSMAPSDYPSLVPSVSLDPSIQPTWIPTGEPSVPPSAIPTFSPSEMPSYSNIPETQLVGMYIEGLVNRFQKNSGTERAFTTLLNEQMIYYWNEVRNGGTVVYESNATFRDIQKPRGNWEVVNVVTGDEPLPEEEVPATPRTAIMPKQDDEEFDEADLSDNDSSILDDVGDDDDTEPPGNFTIPPGIDSNLTKPTLPPRPGNGTIWGNLTNGTLNEPTPWPTTSAPTTSFQPTVSFSPTMAPTFSMQPSFSPSIYPSLRPTVSPSPSAPPSETPPSASPSEQPEQEVWVIWYEHSIVYGEKFPVNDSRHNDLDAIFSYPYKFDQLNFLNNFTNITNNLLPMRILKMEVRSAESSAPSIAPSVTPTTAPSEAPSSLPTPVATQPQERIQTSTLVLAIVVPVLVVLMIAFAGIVYITRVDADELGPGNNFEEITIPSPPQQQAPGTPLSGDEGSQSPVEGGGNQPLQQLPASLIALGTTPVHPLLDESSLRSHPLQQQQQQPISRAPSQAQSTHPLQSQPPPGATSQAQSDLGSWSDHPPTVISGPPPRTPSHGSAVSEITSAEVGGLRRTGMPPQGIPGYMTGTGTFTPTLAPLGGSEIHSRSPSMQSDTSASVAKSTLSRAHTTGGIPSGGSMSGSMSPSRSPGRQSPFQPIRGGGIPTIPTAQLSATHEVADQDITDSQLDMGSGDESDSDDYPSMMAAFNLQIEDLDDM